MIIHEKNIKRIVCVITIVSALFAMMAEAHPVHFSSLLRPAANKNFDGFDAGGQPTPAFFWDRYTHMSRINVGTSASQKAQLTKEFWKQFTALIALDQEVLSGGYKDSPMLRQEEIVPAPQALGHSIAGQRNVFDSILTPEQRKILHKHKELRKMFAKFRVRAVLPTSASTLNASAFIQRAQLFTKDNESGDGSKQSENRLHYVPKSLGYPLSQNLDHTQVLQL